MNLKWWKPKLDESVYKKMDAEKLNEYQKSLSTPIQMRLFLDCWPIMIWFHKNRKFWDFRKMTKANGESILIFKFCWFVITMNW